MRRSLTALAIGAALAVAFTALIVLASPLKAPTAEILARTRPNLFDLLVALFAALAGTFAIIRGRGETIVGVAIATALMPPLAVVGYGLATWNMPVLGGLVRAVRHQLHDDRAGRDGRWRASMASAIIFRASRAGRRRSCCCSSSSAMSIPLGFSLARIAGEAVTATQVRSFLSDRFGTVVARDPARHRFRSRCRSRSARW